jgi:hypothetical protein
MEDVQMKKKLMNLVNQTVLWVLFRGMRVLYRHDDRVRREVDSWSQGLTLKLVCGPDGPVLAMKKGGRSGLRRMPKMHRADITMRFKSVSGAFRVLTGQMGVSEAYAKHLFALEGDICQTMSFVQCVEYAEAYLFPHFWANRILKQVPEKQMSSLAVYARTLLGER